jgi:hypothetical protein
MSVRVFGISPRRAVPRCNSGYGKLDHLRKSNVPSFHPLFRDYQPNWRYSGANLVAEEPLPRECHRTYHLVLPVLGNVEGPLELEMVLLVVVDEARDGIVMASSKHARGCVFLLDYGGMSKVNRQFLM